MCMQKTVFVYELVDSQQTLYVKKFTLQNDLQITFISIDLQRYLASYHQWKLGHDNRLVGEMSILLAARLKISWQSDLPRTADKAYTY